MLTCTTKIFRPLSGLTLLVLLLASGCGGSGGGTIGDGDSGAASCDPSSFSLRCANPQRSDCYQCLISKCCAETLACTSDAKCLACFKSGNYTGCGSAASPLVVCSAKNCNRCNGCYGP